MRVGRPFRLPGPEYLTLLRLYLRSSNRTGGSPASGSPTRSCFGPQRKAKHAAGQVRQPPQLVELHVGVLLTSACSVLMLASQPPAEPPAGVLLHRLPGCRDVAQ